MMIPLVVVAALIAAYVLGWRPSERRDEIPVPKRKRGIDSGPTALNVLEERYARGEISREEYLEIREDLRR